MVLTFLPHSAEHTSNKCIKLSTFTFCHVGMLSYLQQIVWGIMNQHDQSPCPDVVDQPGETDEEDGGYMVNYLLFEILKRKYITEKSVCHLLMKL